MPSAGFLLTPLTALPLEGDPEWTSRCSSWSTLVELEWEKRRERMPSDEREQARGCHDAIRLTSNFAACRHLEDEELKRLATDWIERTQEEWIARGRTDPKPWNGPAEYEACSGEPSRISLGDLVHYRGGWKKLSKGQLPPGVAMGFVGNRKDLDAFELGSWDDHELHVLAEIARARGGEFVAVWTFGHAVHAWRASSPQAGQAPRLEGPFSFRLSAPSGRDPEALDALRAGFEGAVPQPDWDELERQLAAPAIAVAAWFTAFGLPGANELEPADREAVWAAFERVALRHLSGEPAESADVKAVNAVLEPLDAESRLKGKPPKRAGQAARAIAGAAHVLDEALGPAESPRWRLRRRAAAFYWDITEGPAGDRLTLHRSKLGRSAALGRLLGHYPSELARDPIFLALAALEAEAANGHAFVEPFGLLAERAARAGFTVAVHSRDEDASFRKALGIREAEEPAPGELVAHAFLDLPGAESEDVLSALRGWHARSGASGTLVRAEADGAWRVLELTGERETERREGLDRDAFAAAARELVPRRVFAALGLPDLLEPGEWHEGACAGERGDAADDPHRAVARERLRAACAEVDEQPLARGRELRSVLGTRVGYRGECESRIDEFVSVRSSVGPADDAVLRELRDDARLFLSEAWIEDGALLGLDRHRLDTGLLACVLADLPRPVRIAIEAGAVRVRFVLDEGRAG